MSVQVDIHEDMVVQGDESKLRRSISNLVNNAADALHDFKVHDATIKISAMVDGDMVLLYIRDNGPGIPPEIVTTLFNPFVTKDKRNGTGLGLAIVKQYVNAHGGDITMKNENGAVFTISLPLTDR